MKLAVSGATGFVGQAVVAAAHERGIGVQPLPAIRTTLRAGEDPERSIPRWVSENPGLFRELLARLEGAEALVNAAGLADPASTDVDALTAANAVVPGILATAAVQASVNRLVHVSSAAVQGRRRVLNETEEQEPFSPYSWSKALGESVLLRGSVSKPSHLVIYRPTSVQGRGRAVTHRLVRLASSRAVPVCNGGDTPLPLALVENVGAAAVHLATVADPPAVALHPWEGITVRLMFELFGDRPCFLPFPKVLARGAIRLLYTSARVVPTVTDLARRAELLLLGQHVAASSLSKSGFCPPLGIDAYRALAVDVRSELRTDKSTVAGVRREPF